MALKMFKRIRGEYQIEFLMLSIAMEPILRIKMNRRICCSRLGNRRFGKIDARHSITRKEVRENRRAVTLRAPQSQTDQLPFLTAAVNQTGKLSNATLAKNLDCSRPKLDSQSRSNRPFQYSWLLISISLMPSPHQA